MEEERRNKIVTAVETAIVLLAFVPLWLWMFLWRGGRGDWLLYGTLGVLLLITARRLYKLIVWGRRTPPQGGP